MICQVQSPHRNSGHALKSRPASRFRLSLAALAGSVALIAHAGCSSEFGAEFVPQLYSLTVLPPPGGGEYEVEPGGSVTIRLRLQMGVGVSGNEIQVLLLELPDGLDQPITDSVLLFLSPMDAEETVDFSFTLLAHEDIAPGRYRVEFESTVDIQPEVGDELTSQVERAEVHVSVRSPGGVEPPPDNNGDSQGTVTLVIEVRRNGALQGGGNMLVSAPPCFGETYCDGLIDVQGRGLCPGLPVGAEVCVYANCCEGTNFATTTITTTDEGGGMMTVRLAVE